MRKILVTAALMLGLIAPFALTAGRAAAVDISPNCGAGHAGKKVPGVCQDISSQSGDNGSNDPIIKVLKGAINILSYVVGVASIIVLVIAGLRMILAGSNSNDQAAARNSVIYAIVGIMVAVLAQALVIFVLNKV